MGYGLLIGLTMIRVAIIALYEADEESLYSTSIHLKSVAVYDFGTGDTKLFPADLSRCIEGFVVHSFTG